MKLTKEQKKMLTQILDAVDETRSMISLTEQFFIYDGHEDSYDFDQEHEDKLVADLQHLIEQTKEL